MVASVGSRLVIIVMTGRGRLSKARMGCSLVVVMGRSRGSSIVIVRCRNMLSHGYYPRLVVGGRQWGFE